MNTLFKIRYDLLRQEIRKIHIILSQFLHRAGTKVHILMLRCQKHGVQAGVDLMVDQCHLKFVFKIGAGTQAFYDHTTAFPAGILSQQFRRKFYLHIIQILGNTADHIHTLLLVEHGALSGIDHNANDQFIKNFRRTANNVQMTAGNRVKTTGINGNFHIESCSAFCLR